MLINRKSTEIKKFNICTIFTLPLRKIENKKKNEKTKRTKKDIEPELQNDAEKEKEKGYVLVVT